MSFFCVKFSQKRNVRRTVAPGNSLCPAVVEIQAGGTLGGGRGAAGGGVFKEEAHTDGGVGVALMVSDGAQFLCRGFAGVDAEVHASRDFDIVQHGVSVVHRQGIAVLQNGLRFLRQHAHDVGAGIGSALMAAVYLHSIPRVHKGHIGRFRDAGPLPCPAQLAALVFQQAQDVAVVVVL